MTNMHDVEKAKHGDRNLSGADLSGAILHEAES
jgi:uncharacterized protein YjbI with pentapeptide repeats